MEALRCGQGHKVSEGVGYKCCLFSPKTVFIPQCQPATPNPIHPGWCSDAQSCLTLYDPMNCSLSGSSIHGILHARILEWAAVSFSMDTLYHFATSSVSVKFNTKYLKRCLPVPYSPHLYLSGKRERERHIFHAPLESQR